MALSLIAIRTTDASAQQDPYLQSKAQAYFDYAQAYATTGLGGVSEQLFTDDTLAELERLRGTGDSTIWTGMYVAAQSLRYAATGEAQAKTEAARIARYLHTVKAITDTPGYVGRYAAPNQAFWRQEYPDTHDRLYFGTGDYAGLFWIGDTSRDQYTGWWLGMSMAHEFLGDEDLNAVIEADMRDVIDTLIDNDWKIVDNNGDVDGNGAARVGYPLRLAWLIMAWSATGEQDYLDLFHDIFAERKDKLWLDVFSWTNKYAEYFAFNLSHNTFLQLMRLTPDCETHAFLTELYEKKIYKHVKETHNAWYDSVYLVGCRIGGTCSNRQFQKVADDVYQTLTEFWDAPNQA
ncbi:hypothetical protein KDL45_14470, partial [bacterium]|nr:hypothetical protein [bacterium]